MRRRTTCCTLTLALLPLGALGVARAQDAPSPEARQALARFMETDCEVGEAVQAVAALHAHAPALESDLERLLREGPSAEIREAATGRIVERWDARASFLESNPTLGLDPAARLALVTISREAWIGREIRRLERRVRERAAEGLAALGSPRALRALRRALDEVPDADVQARIRTLLGRERWVERERPDPRGRARPRG